MFVCLFVFLIIHKLKPIFMKQIIVMFLVINLMIPFSLFALDGPKSCECGSFENGIYTFSVVGGTNVTCCTGTIYPDSIGQKRNYVFSGGAWEWVSSDVMTGAAAQSHCCNNF